MKALSGTAAGLHGTDERWQSYLGGLGWVLGFGVWDVIPVHINARLQPVEVCILRCGSGGKGGGHRRRGLCWRCQGVARRSEHTLKLAGPFIVPVACSFIFCHCFSIHSI